MKNNIILLILLSANLYLFSKNFKENTINIEEAYNLIRSEKHLVIIDVRTAGEYNEGFIRNSINIDFHKDDFSENIGKLDRHQKYLVYCRSGNRSEKALEIFKKLGFSDFRHMAGGITDWKKYGFPVYTPRDNPSEKK